MPRQNRVSVGGVIYHVLNRSNGRVAIFETDADYRHFESLLLEAKELTGMRIFAYVVMPNHFHLVLYPKKDGDMGEFMRWLTTTHVRQHRTRTKTVGAGHLYQGAYKSFLVEKDKYLRDLIRYVEQNPLRAKLVKRAEQWRFSSLYCRMKGSPKEQKLLAPLPIDLPYNYLASVNMLLPKPTIEQLRLSVTKGTPFGSDRWVGTMVKEYGLASTQRGPGRPKKN